MKSVRVACSCGFGLLTGRQDVSTHPEGRQNTHHGASPLGGLELSKVREHHRQASSRPVHEKAPCVKWQWHFFSVSYIEGILPKGPYLPCASMAGRGLLAGYPRYSLEIKVVMAFSFSSCPPADA